MNKIYKIHAAPPLRQDDTALVEWGIITANGTSIETDGVQDPYNITVYKNLKTGTYRFVKQATDANEFREDAELGTNEVLDAFRASSMQEVYDMLNMGGPSYIAGTGIIISSDNKVSVKAGSNVTVDENGVSVTGNGSVSSGNTGLINGGTAYSELRPSANGNYVKTTQTTAQNLNALDTQVKANATASGNAIKGLSASGTTITYTKNDGTTGTITTQDTKYTAGSGLSLSGTQFSVNTNGSVASGNTGVLNGGTVYSEVRPTADGTFVKKTNREE